MLRVPYNIIRPYANRVSAFDIMLKPVSVTEHGNINRIYIKGLNMIEKTKPNNKRLTTQERRALAKAVVITVGGVALFGYATWLGVCLLDSLVDLEPVTKTEWGDCFQMKLKNNTVDYMRVISGR